MIAYKITTLVKDKFSGKFRRFGLYPYLDEGNIEYHEDGREITPNIPNSLIFVFADKELPIIKNHLYMIEQGRELWEVEVDSLTLLEEIAIIPDLKEASLFWKGDKKVATSKCIGLGYYGCKSLKMIRKIA